MIKNLIILFLFLIPLKMKRGLSEILYVGIDESNHGRFPEVFTAVISNLKNDAIKRKYMKKIKKDFKRFPHGQYRDYTFLLAQKVDYERIPSREMIGTVIGSLIVEDIDSRHTENLEIYLDGGHWTPSSQIYTRDYVSDILSISKENLQLKIGKDLDRKRYVVNLADQQARKIHRKWSLEKASKSKRKRDLLK